MKEAVLILNEAARLVGGDRAETHGDAKELHDKIALLWAAWLLVRRPGPLTAEDIAHMEVLKKMARTQCGTGTQDNYVDAAGYAALAGALRER